jgi:uncharacterized protein YqeY
MALKDRIGDDMKAAMRARQADRLGAIRLLLAAIKQKEIDERVTLDDSQVVAIVDKLIKQRRDSITQFERAGRTDLVDKEKAEVAVLGAYLPAQADSEQVSAIIDEAIAATGASGPADMGRVMAWVKPRLAGRADMGAASAAVKQRLAGTGQTPAFQPSNPKQSSEASSGQPSGDRHAGDGQPGDRQSDDQQSDDQQPGAVPSGA